jgi:DNA-binding beta-propeller fold protein YncE
VSTAKKSGRLTSFGVPFGVAGFVLLLANIAVAQNLAVVLPTAWKVSVPAGAVRVVGTAPQGVAFSPNGDEIAFIESGVATPALHIIDAGSLVDRHQVPMRGISGRPLWDTDGRGLWVGTGAKNSVVHIALTQALETTIDRVLNLPGKQFWADGIARDPTSGRLAIAGMSYGAVVLTNGGVTKIQGVISTGGHPVQPTWSRDGRRLYVPLWAERSIAVVDPLHARLMRKIPVGLHPEAVVLTKNGRALYVANADDDTISQIDTTDGRVVDTYRLDLFGTTLVGLSPTALSLAQDERRLYVVCSAANAIVVLAAEPRMKMLGALPTGWYPTDVAFDGSHNSLVVLDGKGEGSHANPNFPPLPGDAVHAAGYIGNNLVGSVRRIPLPTDADLASATAQVRANAAPDLLAAAEDPTVLLHGPASQDAVEVEGREILIGGSIKHVFYIIKENRTYDQVLGDVSTGDGDPKLTAFGASITPNEHAIAGRFGLYDRAFTDSQVSQDGHVWLTAAFANDFLEKTWPPMYGGRFEEDSPGDPYETRGGYLWAAAARTHISFRSYGEACDPDPRHPGRYKADDPGLVGHIDPDYASFDVKIPDTDRVMEWQREFRQYEKNGDLPSLTWMWLMNDHTAASRTGMRTPRAMVANNDLAVGQVIDTISHSRYWLNTAIFIIEDDAQNGPDHVDEQRTTLYVVSPYSRGGTHHEHYTQNGVTRTVELILGLPPVSTYDAGARPLYAAFQSKPDLRPYQALPARVDLNEVNARTAYGVLDSNQMDFSEPDRAPAAVVNDIIERTSHKSN